MADVQLGTFAKAQVPDPAIAEAAFTLAANEVSQRRQRLVRPGAAARHRNQARGRQAAGRGRGARSASSWRSPKRPASCSTRTIPTKMRAPAAQRSPRPRPSSTSRSSRSTRSTGRRCGRTAQIDRRSAGIARAAEAGLRDRSRHREPGDQHRLDRLRLLRGAGHHAGARPHAGRGARQGRRRLEVGGGRKAARRQGGRTCRSGSRTALRSTQSPPS